jgi:DNA-binding transcriptional MerR regulator
MPKENNKEKALAALLESASVIEAAQKSGLSPKTLYRYLDDSEFKQEYQTERRRIFEQNIFRLQQIHGEAVETLQRNLTCENPAVEVRAAQIVIESNRKDFETFDILERLENLEKETESKNESK